MPRMRVYWENGNWYFEIYKRLPVLHGKRWHEVMFRRQHPSRAEAIREGKDALRVIIERCLRYDEEPPYPAECALDY